MHWLLEKKKLINDVIMKVQKFLKAFAPNLIDTKLKSKIACMY